MSFAELQKDFSVRRNDPDSAELMTGAIAECECTQHF
jgi:hypothetical protein